ncbi:MAG: HAD-IIA family hydrolase [Desulfovibrionaceae bacterium]|nr:HAD-IIA family hydrolase [Desulfovibrionaceae bacterium]
MKTQLQPLSERALLVDIDGVLLIGGRIVPGTEDLAKRFARRLALVSNNSTHSAEDLCAVFVRAGVKVKPEQFFLAGIDTVKQLAHDFPGGKIVALASASIKNLLLQHGLHIIPGHRWHKADAILLCRDLDINYAKLENTANAALAGLPVYCANPDITHPAARGIHLETGSLLALLKTVAPNMRVRVFGKPQPAMALAALDFLNATTSQALFIGDNLVTDLACAQAAGIAFWHVGGVSGISSPQALEQLLLT